MSDPLNQIELISTLSVPRYAPRLKPTPIPTVPWNAEPLFCLQVNDQWVSHILGALEVLDQPDTWIGMPEEIYAARQQVNAIMAAFMEQCDPMSNCCPDPITRIADDGSLEVSYDGGMTWAPATTEDPRNTVPQLPPITGEDGDDKRCKAANNVVRQLKDLQTQWSDSLGGGLTVLQLALAFAAAIAGFFLSAGTLAVFLVPAILALAASLVGTGSEAYDDLFTSDVWDYALCQFYCGAEPDGTYTSTSFNNILANFDTEFSDTLALAFSSALTGWQLVGLNRAARIPSTDNLDCSACDCTTCIDHFAAAFWISGALVNPANGTEISRDDTSIIIQSNDRGDGQQVLSLCAIDGVTCCRVTAQFVDEDGEPTEDGPSSTLHFYNDCPDHAEYNTMVQDNIGPVCRLMTQLYFQMSAGGPWRIKFTFVDVCS